MIKYTFADNETLGVHPSVDERRRALDTYNGYLNDMKTLPVSFKYDDVSYKGLGGKIKEVSRNSNTEDGIVTTDIVFMLKDQIEIRCHTVIYLEYAVYEWTLYFTNTSKDNSKQLTDILCADITFSGEEPVLKGINPDGANDGLGSYSPYEVDMTQSKIIEKYSTTGRSSEGGFPYFNLNLGNRGVILSVGWPGQWNSRFESDGKGNIHFTSGQKTLNAYLKPGESIRTPLMSFFTYDGKDTNRTMNLWRHWFIDCNSRIIKGEQFKPQLFGCTSSMNAEMLNATEDNQIAAIEKYRENGIELTAWWMDAGWYYKTGIEQISIWLESGNWDVDKDKFPTGFRAVTDVCEKYGMISMLWFEPEIVRLPLDMLNDDGIKEEWLLNGGGWRLADLGNKNFRDWLVNKVSGIIETGGISIYRQDYGHGNPVADWISSDEEGRIGIVENKYVQGYLTYWDTLISKFPNMMIDTCASGGGRLDLETMRRSVPLHKTDMYYSDTNIKQSMHQSLFQWFPYFGTIEMGGTADTQLYNIRSDFVPSINLNVSLKSMSTKLDIIKQGTDEWADINKYFNGDYYPLLDWSCGSDKWRGWEFLDPDSQEGYMQFFRPEDSNQDSQVVKLYGLDHSQMYVLTDIDGVNSCTVSGDVLMSEGFTVTLKEARYSTVIHIKASKD